MYLRTVWFEDINKVGDKMMRSPVQKKRPWAGSWGPRLDSFVT